MADLFSPGSRSWNSHLLTNLFDAPTMQSILSIHIPQALSFDKWLWAPSPSGQFSVKSTYECSFLDGGRSSPFSTSAWQAL